MLSESATSNARDYAKKLSRKYNIPEETADWLLNKAGIPPEDADMTEHNYRNLLGKKFTKFYDWQKEQEKKKEKKPKEFSGWL